MSLISVYWSLTVAAALPCFSFTADKNHAPIVRIVRPEHNSLHSPTALIPYSITVSDKEDGESKYDEIPGDQIFLRIEYRENLLQKQTQNGREPKGLINVKRSDCFSCHQFRERLIGPSFADIAVRYRDTLGASEILADKVIRGSQGTWGEAVMPGHSDIPEKMAVEIAEWILTEGANDQLDYRIGKEGSFRPTFPDGVTGGTILLQAAYTDNGLPGKPGTSITGGDTVIIKFR